MSRTLYLHSELNGYTGWGSVITWLAWYASRAGWTVYVQGADFGLLPIGLKLADPWVAIADPAKTLTVDVAITTGGNHFVTPLPANVKAGRTAVITFVEDTLIRQREIDAYNSHAVTICGSAWNHELFTQAGVTNCQTIVQGVDDSAWNTRVTKRGVFGDRRVIFSGGKLEFRKGQDIVVAAFRDYLKDDPDAILLTAWQNAWPQSMKGIDAMGYVKGWPQVKSNGQLDIVGWLGKNGIPARNCRDLGILPNWAAPQIIAEADVAIFPNLAEGGSSLPTMECLALGIPTYATDGTGLTHCIEWGARPLAGETVTAKCQLYHATDGWVQPSVETILQSLRGRAGGYPLTSPPVWSTQAPLMLNAAAGI